MPPGPENAGRDIWPTIQRLPNRRIESSRWIALVILALSSGVGVVVVFVIRQINTVLRKSVVELSESAVQIASAAEPGCRLQPVAGAGSFGTDGNHRRDLQRERRDQFDGAPDHRELAELSRGRGACSGGIREDQSVAR